MPKNANKMKKKKKQDKFWSDNRFLKGKLMQIWKSTYIFKFKQK